MVYPISKRTVVPFIKLWIRKVKGLENIPKDKAFIIAANHGSFYDDLAIPSLITTHINKYSHIYCNDWFYRFFLLKKFLNWGRCIPIRVSDKKTEEQQRINQKAFKDALRFLKNKEPVGIFPEGHRSYSHGRLRQARTGVAKLALTAKVPVLPIGLEGSWNVLPRNAHFPKFKRCNVNIGKLMYFDKYYRKRNDKATLKKITKLIMKEVARLAKVKYNY